MRIWDSVAAGALLAAAPVAALTTNQATPPATSPTPTPAPAGDAVGPPQLRDFSLPGTVTQPAAPPPSTSPTPTPTPPPTSRTAPPSARAPRATPVPQEAAPASAPAPRLPSVATDRSPSPDAGTLDLPPPTTATLTPDAALAPVPVTTTEPAAAEAPRTAWWPWLGAALAIILGAGWLWWQRQREEGARYATDDAQLGALVAAPEVAPVLPRAAPTPPRPASAVRAPVASPPPAPAPTPIPVPKPTPPVTPIPDGIIASGLKPHLAFELVPIRAETDIAEGAALTFDLIVINEGSAPARDVLIEATMMNAGAQVDSEIGRFFMQPAGSGERLPMIAPMARVSLRSRIVVSGPNLTPLVVEGRKLFVPMVAINAAYRWSGGEMKDSSSFLVGRGEGADGKMAPLRLDLGARSWSSLGARIHSTGLN